MKQFLLFLAVLAVLLSITLKQDSLSQKTPLLKNVNETIVSEESATIDAIAKALPSVVTIRIGKTTTTPGRFELNPYDPFSPFRRVPGSQEKIEQNIGSGFVIDKDGLIVTNKHLVADPDATYKVLTNDNKTHDVKKI